MVATEVQDSEFHNKLRTGFTNASHYLFDVTDGQMKLGEIAIYANVTEESAAWYLADMVVFNNPDYQPRAHVNGVAIGGNCHMHFGTEVFGYAPDQRDYVNGYHTSLVHEFGHYALDLCDEYLSGNYSFEGWTTYRQEHPDEAPYTYGLMDSFDR